MLLQVTKYSQLSLRRAPSGPDPTVCLRETEPALGARFIKVSVKRELTVQDLFTD